MVYIQGHPLHWCIIVTDELGVVTPPRPCAKGLWCLVICDQNQEGWSSCRTRWSSSCRTRRWFSCRTRSRSSCRTRSRSSCRTRNRSRTSTNLQGYINHLYFQLISIPKSYCNQFCWQLNQIQNYSRVNLVLFHTCVPKVCDNQGLLHQVVHDQVLELVFLFC